MKVIKYVCDRCNSMIQDDGIFQLCPEKINKDGETVEDLPHDMYGLLSGNKHLCKACVTEIINAAYCGTVASGPKVKETKHASAVIKSGSISIGAPKVIPPISKVVESKKKEGTVMAGDALEYVKIKEAVVAGKSVKEIAALLNVSVATVYNKCHKYKIDLPTKQAAITDQPVATTTAREKQLPRLLSIENVKKAYLGENKTMEQIAKECNLTLQEVRMFLINNNIIKNEKTIAEYKKNH